MKGNSFKKMAKALNAALIDGFRGWLVENNGIIERIEVPDDKFHHQVAFEQLLKEPNWEYKSGTGQAYGVDYMHLKKATYITKLPINQSGTEFQWSAGYLKDVYSNDVKINDDNMMKEYDILCKTIVGLGYDAEEYFFTGEKDNYGNPIVKVNTIHSKEKKIEKRPKPQRKMLPGDRLVFDRFGNLVAVESYGKKHSVNEYPELCPKRAMDTSCNVKKEYSNEER